MFTPTTNVDLVKLWDALGTVYTYLEDDDKAVIETFWTAMFEGIGGMYYNLYQAHLGRFFSYTQGYVERGFQEHNIVFEGENKNVEYIYYPSPGGLTVYNTPDVANSLYSYRITALTDDGETLPCSPVILISGSLDLSTNPNILTWSTFENIDSYNVFGRSLNNQQYLETVYGNIYMDYGNVVPNGDLPSANTAISGLSYRINDGLYYLSIPTLSGINTDQVLYENIDYTIDNLNTIKFLDASDIEYNSANISFENAEKFLAQTSICLLPILGSIYFPGYGESNPNDIISNDLYTPHISGWSNMDYYDQRRLYATHLSQLMYALSNIGRQEPTMSGINHCLSLAYGLPFNYEAGVVTDIGDDGFNKYLKIGDTSYQVPAIMNLLYSMGETVEQFAILVSGMHIDDYISNSGIINPILAEEGSITEFDVFTQQLGKNSSGLKVIKSIIEDVTLVKQSGDYIVI